MIGTKKIEWDIFKMYKQSNFKVGYVLRSRENWELYCSTITCHPNTIGTYSTKIDLNIK